MGVSDGEAEYATHHQRHAPGRRVQAVVGVQHVVAQGEVPDVLLLGHPPPAHGLVRRQRLELLVAKGSTRVRAKDTGHWESLRHTHTHAHTWARYTQ